jgi:glycosyltransferase involved in cell wall biosynthesis
MIVKNEEEVLEKCLDSVRDIADEIIIVDTGSTDNTKEIARKFTDKIYDFKWIDDFAAARNYSYSKATKEYIMWLDADDYFKEEDREKLLHLKKTLKNSVKSVMFKYHYSSDKDGNPTLTFMRERLSKRAENYRWVEPIHEYLDTNGHEMLTDIAVTHNRPDKNDSDRNLRIFEKNIADDKQLSARGTYYYARELYNHGRYDEAKTQFEKFLDERQGWYEDNINACHLLASCYAFEEDWFKALQSAMRSFVYDVPRGELCCDIGNIYQKNKDYEKALFWYKIAAGLDLPKGTIGFVNSDSYNYTPLLEACVCLDKLGRKKEAAEYNERAAAFKPESKAVKQNREYFESLKE